MKRVSAMWRKGLAGKLAVATGGLVVMCCACSALSAVVSPPKPATPTTVAAAEDAAPQATERPSATAPPALTAIPGPTDTPAPPTAAPTETATLTAADAIEQIARTRCRGNYISAKYSQQRTEIECKLKDSLTDNMIVTGAFIDAFELTRDIMRSGMPISLLRIQLIGDFTDKYGNPLRLPAFTFLITRETADKINWPNMQHHGFGQLIASEPDGSSINVHPAWRDNVRDWLAN